MIIDLPCDIVHTLSHLLEAAPDPLLSIVDAGQLHAEAAEDKSKNNHHNQGDNNDYCVTVHQVMHLAFMLMDLMESMKLFDIIRCIICNFVTR